MSRIIFDDDFVAVLPSFDEVEAHSHLMLHLFIGDDCCEIGTGRENIFGEAVFVKENVEHILQRENACKLFFLFDPMSSYGEKAKKLFLKGRDFCAVELKTKALLSRIEEKTDAEIKNICKAILCELFGEESVEPVRDERIEGLIQRIKNNECFNLPIAQIAGEMYISESRLQHLFKQSTGMTLKSYILINQLEYCYKLVILGKSITYAAMESGFSSPAHLAYTCKKSMGISISNVFKNSSFLKA